MEVAFSVGFGEIVGAGVSGVLVEFGVLVIVGEGLVGVGESLGLGLGVSVGSVLDVSVGVGVTDDG